MMGYLYPTTVLIVLLSSAVSVLANMKQMINVTTNFSVINKFVVTAVTTQLVVSVYF